MGRIRDNDKDFLETLIRGLKSTGGASTANGGLAYDGDLANKLRDAYDTISKLEKRNHGLIDIIENLKSTYEFFEISNDLRTLYGNPHLAY